MNNGAQGEPAQGNPSGAAQPQQNRQPQIYRPEQMRKLPDNFTQLEKEKWEAGLRSLYQKMESNGPDSKEHQDAKSKIVDFSRNLTGKLQAFARQRQAAQAQAAQQTQATQQTQQPQQNHQAQQGQQGGAARPASQGQPIAQEGEQSGANPNGAQQSRGIPPKVLEHIQNFPYTLPPNIPSNTPEGAKYLVSLKDRYTKGLLAMENSSQRIATLDGIYAKRNEEGRPLNAEEEKEYRDKKELAAKMHTEAKTFVDQFRRSQQQNRAAANSNQQVGSTQQPGGNSTPVRGPMSATQTTNPALQNTQTVNAAIEAARNQQLGGARPQIPNGQGSQSGPSHQNIPQHQGQVQNIKQEAGIPQINTQMQGRPLQNNSPQSAVPQSAQSAGPQSAASNPQIPKALTHPQALQTAARTYSSGQTSANPGVMGHSHTHPTAPRETQNGITNKLPIPKHLPERATIPPTPVAMSSARPTLSGGPNNNGNGVMGQPALAKAPGYSMNDDGDHILSKKKLDELVRQVTGQGTEEALSPEVEASIMDVADGFVDQVIESACLLAKARGSKTLEIRDIQMVLERNYNIRIPGYASDEIRTVRKVVPAPGWISKMSAVQAAKVTGSSNKEKD